MEEETYRSSQIAMTLLQPLDSISKKILTFFVPNLQRFTPAKRRNHKTESRSINTTWKSRHLRMIKVGTCKGDVTEECKARMCSSFDLYKETHLDA